LSRRVDQEFRNLMNIIRVRDRLQNLAVGPPVNQEVLQIIEPMKAQITREMGRLVDLYDLMSAMALEIRESL